MSTEERHPSLDDRFDPAERVLDAMKLRFGQSRPGGVVIDDANVAYIEGKSAYVAALEAPAVSWARERGWAGGSSGGG